MTHSHNQGTDTMIDDIAEAIRAEHAAIGVEQRSRLKSSVTFMTPDEINVRLARAALAVFHKDMVIVPREATDAMIVAGVKANFDDDDSAHGCAALNVWNAMLSVVE